MDYEGPFKSVKAKRTFFKLFDVKEINTLKLMLFLMEKKVLIWDPMQIDNSGNLSTVSINYSYDGEKAAILTQKVVEKSILFILLKQELVNLLHNPLINIGGFQWDQRSESCLCYSAQRSRHTETASTQNIPALKIGEPIEKAYF